MTKRLSPERIAELRWKTPADLLDLYDHIDTLEAELEAQKAGERASTDELQTCIRVQMKELAEAKAEIARLQELLDLYR